MIRIRQILGPHRDLLLGLVVVAVVSALTLRAGSVSLFAQNGTSATPGGNTSGNTTTPVPDPAPSNSTALSLRVDCVQPDPANPGWFLAAFGYESVVDASLSVFGTRNQVVLLPANDFFGPELLSVAGQPTTFDGGIHQYQFSVRFKSGDSVRWQVLDPVAQQLVKAVASELTATGCAIPGPKGDTGDKGEKGDQGPIGARGLTGNTGPQGPEGPRGNIGPAGPAGLNWLGTWDPTVIYSARDAVSFKGSSFVAIADVTGGNVTPDVSNDWQLLAQRGNQGEQGIQGPEGRQGLQGIQGAQGIQGNQGPAGPAGPAGAAGAIGPMGPTGPAGAPGSVPSGTIIMILHGDQVPSGYTFVGSFDQQIEVPRTPTRGRGDDDRRGRDGDRHEKVQIDLYRKN